MTSLVLLPGLDGTGLLFQPLVRCLPPEIEAIVVSYPSDVALSYEQLLPIVLKALPPGPFVLLGESFSGPLAIMAAACNPAGLQGLILCASFVRSPAAWLPAWCSYLVRPFQFRFYPLVAHLRILLGRFSDPQVRSLVAEAVALVRPEVLAHRIRVVHGVDARDQLASCACPVLYLRGDHDRLVGTSALRSVIRACPSAKVVTVAAPHMVLQTQPEASAVALEAFVQSVRAA
jgi:pimeloyl-[acyl-carrier protein] methyl ester esterase